MNRIKQVAIIGDFDPHSQSHAATTAALVHSAQHLGISPAFDWIGTETIAGSFERITSAYDAFLIAPGGPCRDRDAVLRIIQHARTNERPTLGTCGGFQQMVIEFARNVLSIEDAEHAEYRCDSPALVVTPLSCNLKGRPLDITLSGGDSAVSAIYDTASISETYNCSYGIAPAYQAAFDRSGFVNVGSDDTGEARLLELKGHRFFIAALFLPQASSVPGHPNKLITAFLRA
jgi:CTP synthase (UTP-ammonia lyase)